MKRLHPWVEAMRLRILLLILLPPILLFLWAPLPHPFPPALSAGRDQMSAIVTGILGIGYLIGLAVYVTSSFRRAGRVLDPVLTSTGLASESYLVFGGQYRGVIEGRQVEVCLVPSQGIRPALLNIHVSAKLGARMAIGQRRPLLDCRDCARLEVAELGLGPLQVYAQEEERSRRLLTSPASREALTRVMEAQEEHGFREIYFQPGRVWLPAHPHRMTEELFRQWLEDVLALAETGEEAFESLT